MKNLEKIIIIPDVHGREFWKEPIKKYKNVNGVHIVFLGDYLDPYEDIDLINKEQSFNNFVELLEETKDSNNVTLLIGNHDLHYWPEYISGWGCRRDELRKITISHLFMNNANRFNVAYEIYINNKQYLFTHAGVLKGWFEWITGKSVRQNSLDPNDTFNYGELFGLSDETISRMKINLNANGLNDLLKHKPGRESLNIVSRYRGGYAMHGSCVWADVNEHYSLFTKEDRYEDIYQIFSHSFGSPSLDEYIINDNWAMLDCRKVFELDCKTGKITEYKNGDS